MRPTGKCPKCKKEIDHLLCRTMEYKYTYDGDYNPLPMSEPFEMVFVCPECGSTVAASEREADAILGITKPEVVGGGPTP
jgi:hypothetical protein